MDIDLAQRRTTQNFINCWRISLCTVYVQDCALVKEEKKSEAKKKNDDHRKGEEMHRAAMMSR